MRLYRLQVTRIELQPTKLNPIPKSKNLDLIRFKRAIVTFRLTEGSEEAFRLNEGLAESELRGILDFRGRMLALSSRAGKGSVQWTMEVLADMYRGKYNREGLGFPEPGEEDIWESPVAHPDRFLGYLHYIMQRKTGLNLASEGPVP